MATKSIWAETVDIAPRAELKKDISVDAAVIGAGMAGVLTAYLLSTLGINTAVLEAERIASGQTHNTTAKITSQHSLIYSSLIQNSGRDKARQYAQANQRAISEYRRIIHEQNIECDFHDTSAYLYSTTDSELMHDEVAAACESGIDAQFIKNLQLPFKIRGAVCFPGQAQFHPLKFINALARNLDIYEHTRVLNVEGHVIHTAQADVHAKHIVFATHFPFVNFPGWYFMRMHQERSYVLALEHAQIPDGMFYGVDEDTLSLRTAGEHLLLGGGNHRTGENSTGGKYDWLRERAHELFPEGREVAHWSAQDCITLDGMPYIGNYSRSEPDWYVATGFAKWGMSNSMVAAMLISDMICGNDARWGNVFSPQRFQLSASAAMLATETAQSFKGLTRELISIPAATLESLPAGHGGIIDWDGDKAGVYKDEAGKVYAIKPRCPHLGCQLEWNPDERSWDCPCHGSRFSFDGSLIDNPAQSQI